MIQQQSLAQDKTLQQRDSLAQPSHSHSFRASLWTVYMHQSVYFHPKCMSFWVMASSVLFHSSRPSRMLGPDVALYYPWFPLVL